MIRVEGSIRDDDMVHEENAHDLTGLVDLVGQQIIVLLGIGLLLGWLWQIAKMVALLRNTSFMMRRTSMAVSVIPP